jgi:uncharacterized repeat protein (TIGR01451 family)
VPVDLAVSISADKSSYEEQQVITYTINYRNKSNSTALGTIIKAEIPKFTKVEDAAGGKVSGTSIEWSIGDLAGNAVKSITYKVKVDLLSQAEMYTENSVSISCLNPLVNTEDDTSSIKVLLYSNRYAVGSHTAYIKGYPDKTFKPEKEVTRAEIATMFARIMGLDISTNYTQTYDDVSPKHWAAASIEAVSRAGIFKGDDKGLFNPDAPITRAELATTIFRYLKLNNVTPFDMHFTDIEGHWAANFIEEIYRFNIIKGYDDGTFKPNNKIKRSEVVTMFNRMLYRGPLTGVESSFPDVKKTHWAHGHIEEASRDHKYKRDEAGNEVIVK